MIVWFVTAVKGFGWQEVYLHLAAGCAVFVDNKHVFECVNSPEPGTVVTKIS